MKWKRIQWRKIGIAGLALAVPAFLALEAVTSSPVSAQAEDAEYVGNQQCKVCHNKESEGAQWSKWQEMKHAHALDALKSDQAKQIAQERGLEVAPHENPDCVKCHVTAYDPETKSTPAKIDMADSIQCESCHGPGSVHIDFAKKYTFQKKEEAKEQAIAALKTPDEQTCLECHNDESPTWDPEKFTTESGEKVGFDFEQAWAMIEHDNPKTED